MIKWCPRPGCNRAVRIPNSLIGTSASSAPPSAAHVVSSGSNPAFFPARMSAPAPAPLSAQSQPTGQSGEEGTGASSTSCGMVPESSRIEQASGVMASLSIAFASGSSVELPLSHAVDCGVGHYFCW